MVEDFVDIKTMHLVFFRIYRSRDEYFLTFITLLLYGHIGLNPFGRGLRRHHDHVFSHVGWIKEKNIYFF